MSPSMLAAPRRFPLSLILVALIGLALSPASTMADQPSANPTSLQFASGGTIRMKLNKGDMEVVGVADDRIKVSWHSTSAADERRVKVRVQRSGDRDATVSVDGPGDEMRYRIEVPRQSDLVIHMRAGELDVRGIAGSMDIDLMAGQMDLRLSDPARYRSVNASVTVGELDAKPWRADTGGLWRSFRMTGEGDYDLRARLIAGQLSIRTE